MKNNKIYLALLLAFASTSVIADNQTLNFKASSILTATCSLSANSLNFGAFILPLSSQPASSSISMLCSNKAPYTIDLSYGGVYGQGQTGDGSYWKYENTPNSYEQLYYKYSATGVHIDSRYIMASGGGTLQMAADSLGCTFNAGRTLCFTARPSYDYGIMKGAAKGDSVAYSIFVPDDNSKVWNTGKNSFSGIGTGQEETINFQAKIVPAQSGSTYPTPDFYMDIVTATVTY